MSELPPYAYINDFAELKNFCDALQSKSFVAIDTEFMREDTYKPLLCLIQIKSGDLLAIVDALALDDLSPLTDILNNVAITKVFHAASQDLEVFYWLNKKVPTPLFDTQIAAPVLGYAEQIGYANLVRELLGIDLSKAHTRADWARRPLPDNQLSYALDDVIHLESLYTNMHAELSRLQRLAWLAEDFTGLEDVRKYDKPVDEVWRKIRGAHKLNKTSLAVFQALTAWRELQARESNLPRNWLIKDDVLFDLSKQMPVSSEELEHIRGLSKRVKKQYAERLVDEIKAAKERKPQPLPPHEKKTKLSTEHQLAVDMLSLMVQLIATKLNINPNSLANRKLLEACIREGHCQDIQGWRKPLLANALDELLRGDCYLGFEDGEVSTILSNR